MFYNIVFFVLYLCDNQGICSTMILLRSMSTSRPSSRQIHNPLQETYVSINLHGYSLIPPISSLRLPKSGAMYSERFQRNQRMYPQMSSRFPTTKMHGKHSMRLRAVFIVHLPLPRQEGRTT